MAGNVEQLLTSTRPNIAALPGGWEPDPAEIPTLSNLQSQISKFEHSCLSIEKGLSIEDCQSLIGLMHRSPNFESVSIQGRKDIPDNRKGSIRTTVWAPKLSKQLWEKIKGHVPSRNMSPFTPTDWWQGDKNRRYWYPVAMSPLLRFMQYESGGQHYSHYDAGFIYNDDSYRTLQSVVIYLTNAAYSGATRFIRDNQDKEPIWNRNHLDWTREAEPTEVIFKSIPKQGKVIIFDHRICHDVEPYYESGPRIIIRADIVFRGHYGPVEN